MVLKKFVRKVLLVLLVIFGIYFVVMYLYSEKFQFRYSPFGKSVFYESSDTKNSYDVDLEDAYSRSRDYQTGWQPFPRKDCEKAVGEGGGGGCRVKEEGKEAATKKDTNSDIDLAALEIILGSSAPAVRREHSPHKVDKSDRISDHSKRGDEKDKLGDTPIETKEGSKGDVGRLDAKLEEKKPDMSKRNDGVKHQEPLNTRERNVGTKILDNNPDLKVLLEQKPATPTKENLEEKNNDSSNPNPKVQEHKLKKHKDDVAKTPESEGKEEEAEPQVVNVPPKSVMKEHAWGTAPYMETRTFQAADGASLFAYSAFWDMDNSVRIFGLFERINYHPNLTCNLWVSNPPARDEVPIKTTFKLVILPEHHSKKYSAGYVVCRPPPDAYKRNPILVTLTVQRSARSARSAQSTDPTQTNVALLIHQKENWSAKFTVCIAPLFNSYDQAGTILEMVEFNRILGADKFVFYNYSIGPRVAEVLNHYKRQGVVEIMDWPLPVKALTTNGPRNKGFDIHYFGQLTAMNDCVYRSRHQSDYVVLTDIDEFIVPNITTNMSTWNELIAARKKVKPKATVFWVKNLFFRLKWAKSEDAFFFHADDPASKHKSVLLSNLYREDTFSPYGDRSKNIVDPLGVRIVGIHNIWEKGGPRDTVPDWQATVHHYRFRYWPEDTQKRIYDDSVRNKYGTDIKKNVLNTWDQIKRETGKFK